MSVRVRGQSETEITVQRLYRSNLFFLSFALASAPALADLKFIQLKVLVAVIVELRLATF